MPRHTAFILSLAAAVASASAKAPLHSAAAVSPANALASVLTASHPNGAFAVGSQAGLASSRRSQTPRMSSASRRELVPRLLGAGAAAAALVAQAEEEQAEDDPTLSANLIITAFPFALVAGVVVLFAGPTIFGAGVVPRLLDKGLSFGRADGRGKAIDKTKGRKVQDTGAKKSGGGFKLR